MAPTLQTLKEDPNYKILFENPIDLAKEVRKNYHLFLSKKAFKTFIGYANQQLRRLENALVRDIYDQADKGRHIGKSIETQFLAGGMPDSISREAFVFETRNSESENFEKELYVSIHFDNVPLRDFLNTQSIMQNTIILL